MAELAVQAGIDIEFATKDDVKTLNKKLDNMKVHGENALWRASDSLKADANGLINSRTIFCVPAGQVWHLRGALIWGDLHTPANPLVNGGTNVWAGLYKDDINNGSLLAYAPDPDSSQKVVLPFSWTWGMLEAVFKENERLLFQMNAASANENITVIYRVVSEPMARSVY